MNASFENNKPYDDDRRNADRYQADRYNDNDVNPKIVEGHEMYEGIQSVPDGATIMDDGIPKQVTSLPMRKYLRSIGEDPNNWRKIMKLYNVDGLKFAQHYWAREDGSMGFFHLDGSTGWIDY
jgi:hypothetical protein